ncbi:ABC transporter family substrate-binding protein [Streptomyces sp. NPDC018045]|uniref:ABC transporter family substrate-binding protein n=1 Tax=Streptomyces sp. NPDC018045 TaxID=3365037 RepID=UPI0037A290A4
MKLSRVPLALVATAVVSSLALTACGGPDDERGDGRPKPPPKTTALDINRTDPAQLKQGGTLNWAIDQFPVQFNEMETDGNQAATNAVVEAVMPSLWHSAPNGEQVPNKAFLLDAASRTEGGKQVVTYHLNPRAKWSDGTPVTYRDLAANVRALSRKDAAFKVGSPAGYEDVASVRRGKDDHEAVLTFGKPYADWRALFGAPNNTPLYPAKYMADAKGFTTGYLNRIPVTANAYKLGGIDRTAQTVTLVPDPAWWGEKPKLDKIVFHAMTTESMPAAYANGEIDYFDLNAGVAAFKQASGVKTGEIREAGGPNYRHLTFNGRSPKLSDPRVRRALFKATDRETLVKSSVKGLNWEARPLNNHFLVPSQKGYRNNAGDLGTYDPKGAARLLDEAGWKLDGTVRKKGGEELKLRFLIPTGQPASKNEATILTQMWAQAGVRLDIRTVPVNEFFDKYLTPGDYDVAPYSFSRTPFPATGSSGTYARDGGGNDSKTGSAKLDDLLDKASRSTGRAAALEAVNEADAEAWRIAGVLPTYQLPEITAAKKTLANLGAQGMADIIYERIGYTA